MERRVETPDENFRRCVPTVSCALLLSSSAAHWHPQCSGQSSQGLEAEPDDVQAGSSAVPPVRSSRPLSEKPSPRSAGTAAATRRDKSLPEPETIAARGKGCRRAAPPISLPDFPAPCQLFQLDVKLCRQPKPPAALTPKYYKYAFWELTGIEDMRPQAPTTRPR